MIHSFSDLTKGQRLAGVIVDGEVAVVAVDVHGATSATLTYRTGGGKLDERIVTLDDLAGIDQVAETRWSFDADGAMFRLASEARRMKWAHLADPFAAVDTSNIEPYPHQIDAVYNRFLERRPLRFLLADDPGGDPRTAPGSPPGRTTPGRASSSSRAPAPSTPTPVATPTTSLQYDDDPSAPSVVSHRGIDSEHRHVTASPAPMTLQDLDRGARRISVLPEQVWRQLREIDHLDVRGRPGREACDRDRCGVTEAGLEPSEHGRRLR